MLVGRLASKMAFVFVLSTVSGCGTTLLNYSACDIQQLVEVSGNEFESTVKYLGPVILSEGERSAKQDVQSLRLYAERAKRTGRIKYYVLTDVRYPKGFRYYRKASFDDSTQVSVKTKWFAENPCSGRHCLKNYSAQLPVSLNRMLNSQELKFRLESVTGQNNVFTVPRNHMEGFIQATSTNGPDQCTWVAQADSLRASSAS